jgi:glutamate N-acetyltransferase/amino-acid N-acetyltransferase
MSAPPFFRSRWVSAPDGIDELDASELAPGFRAAGVESGIKRTGLDLGLMVCDEAGVSSAAVFTRNAAAAAPVRVTRERSTLGGLRAILANSGNANAATGAEGVADARAMQEQAGDLLELEPATVGVASTGVIGVPLPMKSVAAGAIAADAELSRAGGAAFSEAIMTTDNAPKRCSLRGGGVALSAQAKGAGMIEPGFATMLCFVQTDALVPDPEPLLRSALASSFERITVDGQLSTNDSVFLQASGTAGKPLPPELLDAVLLQLAIDVLADGEGATRVARLGLSGAADSDEAERVARTIANSQLVQTALFGRDPNWGRIVQAAGMALAGGEVELAANNVDATELGEDRSEVEIQVDLGRGGAGATVFFSDLTPGYVGLNAEYS